MSATPAKQGLISSSPSTAPRPGTPTSSSSGSTESKTASKLGLLIGSSRARQRPPVLPPLPSIPRPTGKVTREFMVTRRRHRVILLGDARVGKTALKTQFVEGYFRRDYDPTIEDCYLKQLVIDRGPVILEILDTGGNKDFSTLRSPYLGTGHGYILVFDITNRTSFENIKNYHREVYAAKDGDKIPIILVANKCDLGKRREVTNEEIMHLSIQFDAPIIEASARGDWHVQEIFYNLVRVIRAHKQRAEQLKIESEGGVATKANGQKKVGRNNSSRTRTRTHAALCSIV